ASALDRTSSYDPRSKAKDIDRMSPSRKRGRMSRSKVTCSSISASLGRDDECRAVGVLDDAGDLHGSALPLPAPPETHGRVNTPPSGVFALGASSHPCLPF